MRKMALVDPLMLKSVGENTTPQPPVDKILRDLDAEMTSMSDGDERERRYAFTTRCCYATTT